MQPPPRLHTEVSEKIRIGEYSGWNTVKSFFGFGSTGLVKKMNELWILSGHKGPNKRMPVGAEPVLRKKTKQNPEQPTEAIPLGTLCSCTTYFEIIST